MFNYLGASQENLRLSKSVSHVICFPRAKSEFPFCWRKATGKAGQSQQKANKCTIPKRNTPHVAPFPKRPHDLRWVKRVDDVSHVLRSRSSFSSAGFASARERSQANVCFRWRERLGGKNPYEEEQKRLDWFKGPKSSLEMAKLFGLSEACLFKGLWSSKQLGSFAMDKFIFPNQPFFPDFWHNSFSYIL